jgi:hypothetical protein
MKKELIGKTAQGDSLFRVDGNEVRRELDVDFTLGSHYLVEDYIPDGEIWIEEMPKHEDECANATHEIPEVFLMKKEGLPYPVAHEIVCDFEKVVRKFLPACAVLDLFLEPARKEQFKDAFRKASHGAYKG